jgi:hypothetical protein
MPVGKGHMGMDHIEFEVTPDAVYKPADPPVHPLPRMRQQARTREFQVSGIINAGPVHFRLPGDGSIGFPLAF